MQSEEQDYSKRQDRLGGAADLAKRHLLVHLQELFFQAEPSTVELDEILQKIRYVLVLPASHVLLNRSGCNDADQYLYRKAKKAEEK